MQNDIPEARRQEAPSSKRSTGVSFLMPVMVFIGVLGLAGISWLSFGRGTVTGDLEETPPDVSTTNPDLLGHLPYGEVDNTLLEPLRSAPDIQLHYTAASAFDSMVDRAREDGIDLVALSGYRSREDQEYLFFRVKE